MIWLLEIFNYLKKLQFEKYSLSIYKFLFCQIKVSNINKFSIYFLLKILCTSAFQLYLKLQSSIFETQIGTYIDQKENIKITQES